MTTSASDLRYIDSDGHVLEHPTAMPDSAPAEYRDCIWHVEADELDQDGVALAVLSPTPLLGLQGMTDVPFTPIALYGIGK